MLLYIVSIVLLLNFHQASPGKYDYVGNLLYTEAEYQDLNKILSKTCGIRNYKTPYVLGGTEAAKKQWPWFVQILSEDNSGRLVHGCGGTLISPWHILTAAHCLIELEEKRNHRKVCKKFFPTEKTYISYGSIESAAEDKDMSVYAKVHEMTPHPKYARMSCNGPYDIAIITLMEPVPKKLIDSGRVRMACLPTAKDKLGKYLTITGFGQHSNLNSSNWYRFRHHPSEKLLYTQLQTTPRKKCNKKLKLKSGLKNTIVCTTQHTKNFCKGDSGSGLMQQIPNNEKRWQILSVASASAPCESIHDLTLEKSESRRKKNRVKIQAKSTDVRASLRWIGRVTGLNYPTTKLKKNLRHS